LTESAEAAARAKGTYFAAQYARIKGRRGHKKAIVAVAHSILVIAYHILKDGQRHNELGADYFVQRRSYRSVPYATRRSTRAPGIRRNYRTARRTVGALGLHFMLGLRSRDPSCLGFAQVARVACRTSPTSSSSDAVDTAGRLQGRSATWPPRPLLGNYRSVPIKAVFGEHVLGIDDVAARDGVVAVTNSGNKTFGKRVVLWIVREIL
jgi:hypothetical protein